MVYMFNECSLAPSNSRETAVQMLAQFIRTHIRAGELGLTELRVYEYAIQSLYMLPMSNGYNIDDWFDDPSVNNDLKERFREILTSYPLISNGELNDDDLFQRSEFSIGADAIKVQVWGLGAAHVYETLSISLNTNEIWQTPLVHISHYSIDLEANENSNEVDVKHFSSIDILEQHKNWIEKYQIDHVTKSQELWGNRETLFPNLEFTEEVEGQLKKVGVSKTLFQIFDRIKSLNDYAKKWTQGNFSIDDVNSKTNLRISLESDGTMKNYGSQRKFKIKGRKSKDVFEPHIKTGNLRFHFYADNDEKKIYIGYIGKHLRTISQK